MSFIIAETKKRLLAVHIIIIFTIILIMTLFSI